jgi:hypothetical protein
MMVVCERCKEEEAEWQCETCKLPIGVECTRVINGKYYCIEHVPVQPAQEKPATTYPGLRMSIWTVLILLIGSGAIFFVMQSYAASMPAVPIPGIASIVGLFQTVGLSIVGGLAVLLAILVIAYVALRRRKR